jgi:16S rRNA (guanine(966)-N(2))-methyltransferase RsmD
VRIIAGEFKGQRLTTPRGRVTRPTADQVRIALMDTLAPRLPGARLLDVFAGAGGVGLEALSRGAARATFIERDAAAVSALRRNIETLGVGDRARVLALDVTRALSRLEAEGERFDVVFLDPPYDSALTATTLDRLAAGGLLAAGSVVVAQHFTKRAPAPQIGRLAAYRTRRFGETTLTFFRTAEYDSSSAASMIEGS